MKLWKAEALQRTLKIKVAPKVSGPLSGLLLSFSHLPKQGLGLEDF